ncbi:MAG: group II intron maturase-specific domain-containing protein [Desulfobia sp.]
MNIWTCSIFDPWFSESSCGFLGFVFVRGKIKWSDKSFREFKRCIRRLTGRSWFVSMDYRYKKLAEYIRGWMNYYGISEYYRPIPLIGVKTPGYPIRFSDKYFFDAPPLQPKWLVLHPEWNK